MLLAILGALGLIFMLGTALMGGGGPGPATNFNHQVAMEVAQQAHVIRAELIACSVSFPGDNGTSFRASLPAAVTPTELSTLTCPGKQVPQNALFGSGGTADLPTAPNATQGWKFVNDATSARLELVAEDDSLLPGMELAKKRLGTRASLDEASRTLTVVVKQ